MTTTNRKQSSLDESILNRYISLPPYQWIVEGMTPSTIEKFEIKTKYSEKSKELEEAIIPIRHYETGKLLAINRRNMREESISRVFGIPKYSITSGYIKRQHIQEQIVA